MAQRLVLPHHGRTLLCGRLRSSMDTSPTAAVRSRKKRAASVPARVGDDGARARSSTNALLDETIAIWQPRAPRRLTREDARQIIENMTGFFSVLREWDRAERASAAPPMPDGSGPECAPLPDKSALT